MTQSLLALLGDEDERAFEQVRHRPRHVSIAICKRAPRSIRGILRHVSSKRTD